MDVRCPFFQNVATVLIGVLFLNPIVATAAELTIDAAAGGNAQLGQAGNGVPIVNIATPNANGLSHNKFRDYNVDAQGLILNNATSRTQSTQLGGIIVGNPNLTGGAAGLILNEVTGSNPTQLRGYTEVAGQSAHVIVANPYGVTCNGCGFINTPHATLTTGKPVIDNGRLSSFDVNGGAITIEGAGLNASNIDQFDLITRSAKLNADIYANRLNVITGRNQVDAATLATTAKSDDGSAEPQLAIDSSALGGMYAGAIRLVGTEAGVGVKLAGNMAASAGDIQIDANGQLSMAQTSTAGSLHANAQDIVLNGPTYAAGNVELSAAGQLSNAQSLAAGSTIALSAANISNSGVIEAGVNPDNGRNARGDVSVTAQNLRNNGSVVASRNLDIATSGLLDNQGGSLRGGSATLNVAQLNNQQGRLLAESNLTLSGPQLNNSNGQVGARTIQVQGGVLDNRLGLFSAEQALNLNLVSLDNSQQGTLASRGRLDATLSSSLNNSAGGLINSSGDLRLRAQSITSSQGEISAGGSLQLTTQELVQQGGRLVGQGAVSLDLQGGSLDNRQGLLSAGSLSLANLGRIDNRGGEISSQQSFGLSVQHLDNSLQGRIISAGQLDLHADQLLNGGLGLLSGWQGLTVSGGSVDNSGGTLSSKSGTLNVTLSGTLDNHAQGALVSLGKQQISAATLDNRGGIVSGQSDIDLSVSQLDNSGNGLINAQQQLNLSNTNAVLNNQGGQLSAGSLLLKGQSLDNSGGQLLSEDALSATLSGALINANNARLASGGVLLLSAANLDNRGGKLSSQTSADITLTQGNLDNSEQGTLASQHALVIKALNGRLLNSQDGLIDSRGSLTLQAAGVDNQQGLINGRGDTRVVLSGALNNAQGRIQSDAGQLVLQSASTDNRGGIFNAVQGMLSLVTGYFNNVTGIAQGSNATVTASGGLNNQQGHLAATVGDLNLDTGTAAFDNQNGGLYAIEQLTVSAGDFLNGNGRVGASSIDFRLGKALNNSGGLIEAGTSLSLAAASLSNVQGRLRALGQSGETRISTTGTLDNRQGSLETAADTLRLTSGSLQNDGGSVLHLGNGQFLIDLAQLGQAGGHFITQSVLSIDAPDWTLNSSLQARVLNLNVGQLRLGAGGQLLAAQSLTGSGGTWSNDGLIASDGTLNLTLAGTYKGNGRLTSQGDLSLTANQLDLNQSASIAGGAKGSVNANVLNNHGQISTTGELVTRVATLNNFGSLGTASNLRIESVSVLNQGGFIFSGQDMSLRVGSLSNQAGDLYSLGNLHIAANDQDGRAARVENISGSIESAGTLTLLAQDFSNRRADDFQIGQQIVSGNIYMFADDVCDGKGCEFKFQSWERYEDVILQDAPQASITAGGDFRFRGQSFDNLYSSIASGGNIDIQTATFRNRGAAGGVQRHLDGSFYTRGDSYYWTFRANKDLYNRYNDPNSPDYNPGALTRLQVMESGGYPSQNFYELSSSEVLVSGSPVASAVIQAAGDVSITASEEFNNSVVRRDAGSQAIGNRDVSTSTGSSTGQYAITSQLPPDLAQQQVNPITLPGFSLPEGSNGLFRLSGQDGSDSEQSTPDLSGLGQGVAQVQGVPGATTPDNRHKYLIETNPALTNLKQFMSSDYLLGLLGYDPDKAQKRLGDGLYEQRLIQQAVVNRTGQRYIDGLSSDEALFKYLMDNAIASKDVLHLSLGVSLSAEQVAALTHDIVWLEETEVHGEKILVPVLYLAQANHRLAPNGSLIQGQNLNLISGGDLNNQGTLRASGDLAASAANINNSGLIEASKRLDLLALDSIRNAAGGIINGRDVSLTALTGDVVNERSITALDLTAGNDRIHREIANNAARIEARGDLAIDAGRDLINSGSAIQAGGNASLSAGRDVHLDAAQETDSTDYQSRRMKGNLTEVTQHASEVTIGGNLNIDAGRDVSVIGSQVDAKDDIAISAGGDVTIASAANESHSDNQYKGGGKKVNTQDDHIQQQSSSLTAGGDVLISAGENLTLVSSKIGAGNEAYLVAGDKLALLAAQDSDYSLYDMEKKGSFGSKETKRDEVTDVKNIGSEIKTGGDLTLVSGGDQLYQGAKLDSGKDLTLVSGGAITFEAVKDLHQESHEKSKGDLAWTSASGKGTTDETLRQSELIANGQTVIKAVDGLRIDIKQINQQTVSQTIDAMVQADPNLAWLKDAETRGDVDWQRVQEIHDSFKYSSSGLGVGAQLAVAIVVTYLTWGAASAAVGTAANATAGSGAAMAAAGSNALGASVAAGWGNIAATSVITSAATTGATSAINNKGDLSLALKDTFNSDSLKNYVAAGVSGGIGNTSLGLQLAVNSAMKTVLQGGKFKDNLTQAAVDLAASALSGAIYEQVGNSLIGAGLPTKVAVHAIVGGLIAEAAGGDFRTGALAAGANEAVIAAFGSDMFPGEAHDRVLAMTSQLIGITVAAGAGGDSKAQEKAGWVAQQATLNNYLDHEEVDAMAKELIGCRASGDPVACRGQVQSRYQALNDQKTGAVLYGCKSEGESACSGQLSAAKEGSGKLDWLMGLGALSNDEKEVLGHFQDINHNDERVADHAWLQSFWQESGAAGGVLGAVGPSMALRVAAGEAKVMANSAPVVDRAATGVEWGAGIKGQGMPWEDFLAGQMPASSRLPANFKTFDFYDEATKTAISAKTLDTTTAAKIANPSQVYSSLKGNIDSVTKFSNYELQPVNLKAADIVVREVQVAVPKATTPAQWVEINRANQYAASQGVKLKVTVIE